MSKAKGSTDFARESKSANGWDSAISDAEEMIQEAKEKIKRLKRSIQTFISMRERGVPFPDEPETFEASDGLLGQEGDLRQSPIAWALPQYPLNFKHL
jgi:hypothetical protein